MGDRESSLFASFRRPLLALNRAEQGTAQLKGAENTPKSPPERSKTLWGSVQIFVVFIPIGMHGIIRIKKQIRQSQGHGVAPQCSAPPLG